jgi:hypothetical protein
VIFCNVSSSLHVVWWKVYSQSQCPGVKHASTSLYTLYTEVLHALFLWCMPSLEWYTCLCPFEYLHYIQKSFSPCPYDMCYLGDPSRSEMCCVQSLPHSVTLFTTCPVSLYWHVLSYDSLSVTLVSVTLLQFSEIHQVHPFVVSILVHECRQSPRTGSATSCVCDPCQSCHICLGFPHGLKHTTIMLCLF